MIGEGNHHSLLVLIHIEHLLEHLIMIAGGIVIVSYLLPLFLCQICILTFDILPFEMLVSLVLRIALGGIEMLSHKMEED